MLRTLGRASWAVCNGCAGRYKGAGVLCNQETTKLHPCNIVDVSQKIRSNIADILHLFTHTYNPESL